MDTKTLTLIPRNIEAVQVTSESIEPIAEWVQSKLPFQKVVVAKDRLYLPSSEITTDILEFGDWVFYDPQDGSFRGCTDDAVQAYYMEVPEE